MTKPENPSRETARLALPAKARRGARYLWSPVLLLASFLATTPSADARFGEIHELHHSSGGSNNSFVQVDADTFALAYADAELLGSLATFDISADGTTISEVYEVRFDLDDTSHTSLVRVDADTFALAYRREDYTGQFNARTITSEGIIHPTQFLEFESFDGSYNSLVRVDDDTVALAYGPFGGKIETFSIPAGGLSISEVASLEHDPSGYFNSLVHVTGDLYALAHGFDFGRITTFTISQDGATITEIQELTHAFHGWHNSLVRVDHDTIALAFDGDYSDGMIKTFDISADGTTITEVQVLVHDNRSSVDNSLVAVGDGIFALAYTRQIPHEPPLPFLKVFEISADGTSIVELGALQHDTSGRHHSLVHVAGETVALAYQGPGSSGILKTFQVPGKVADLSIFKTDGRTTAVPGQSVTYQIVAANDGPDDIDGVEVEDLFPSALTCTYSSIAAGGATGNTAAGTGDIADTLSMPVDSSVLYLAECAIAPDATGTLTNTATITGPVIDTNPENDAWTDQTILTPRADISVAQTDGVTTATPGGSIGYTIAVANAGPNPDPAVAFTDDFPSDLSCTFTSLASAGASGNTPTGSGDLADTLSLPAGSSVLYLVDCAIDPGATGTLANTATVDGSVFDPKAANDSWTESATLTPRADVAVTVTDGVVAATPGLEVVYTIVASNAGPSSDPSVAVSDAFPAELSCTFTGIAAGGATGHTAVGTGDLADSLSLPPGSSVTYTAECAIDPAATGTLFNTATVTASVFDPNAGDDVATDDTGLDPEADLGITATDGRTAVAPGASLVYTVVASNDGPSTDPTADVDDVFPSELTCSFTSVAEGGATGNTAVGAGDLAETVSLPPGSSVTYTAECAVDPEATGTLSNTARVFASVSDPNPDNDEATDETELDPDAEVPLFSDGFESGDTTLWK